jgi:hypothetical protein
VIREKRFLGRSSRRMSDVNFVQKRAGTILSDGINKFLSFLCLFMTLVRELNCHTVYSKDHCNYSTHKVLSVFPSRCSVVASTADVPILCVPELPPVSTTATLVSE